MKRQNPKEIKENNNEINDNKKSENKINNLFTNFKVLISKDDQKIFDERLNKINVSKSEEKLEKPKEILLEEKKAKSDTEIESQREFKFILSKEKKFEDIYNNNWNKNIKNLVIDGDNVLNKLSKDDLILKKCRETAIIKIKNLEGDDINKVLNLLSYDNTNPHLLFICFKRLKNKKCFEKYLNKYKYCLSDEMDIIDYNNNNKIIHCELKKEFNYKFVFKNKIEAKKLVINTLEYLKDLIILYRNSNNQKFIFEYDFIDDGNIIIKNKNIIKIDEIKLYETGFNFIKNYLIIKDFKNFVQNQPFSYERNEKLYFSFLINEIYKIFAEIKESKIINKIILDNDYLKVSFYLIPIINSILIDLKNNKIDKEFISKIRFFNLVYESKNLDNFENLNNNFLAHIIKQKLTEKDIKDFIINKTAINKIYGINAKYEFKDNKLTIKKDKEIIEYNINDYDKSLINELYNDDISIEGLWKYNSFESFQKHNFLCIDDLELVKKTMKNIFKSKFWEQILTSYCDNDIAEISFFQNDEFIDQFLERIIFIPFNIRHVDFFAITTSDDLIIYISGYPFDIKIDNYKKYVLYRILQSGVLVIIIMQEYVLYIKRLIFFVTCGMVERITINNNIRDEGGNIFEEILFGWKEKKEKKINIITGLKLLNSKIYENNIETVRMILSDKENYEEEKDIILSNYLYKIGLQNKEDYELFIKKNKNIYMNASKENLNEEYTITYIKQDHSKLRV
mgnify:CR=1 FL=1